MNKYIYWGINGLFLIGVVYVIYAMTTPGFDSVEQGIFNRLAWISGIWIIIEMIYRTTNKIEPVGVDKH